MQVYTFYEQGNSIYYMLKPTDNFVVESLNCDLPSCDAFKLTSNSEIVGYRFDCSQRLRTVLPNYLLISDKHPTDWEYYLGFPGIQTYLSPNGVIIISTMVSKYMQRIK